MYDVCYNMLEGTICVTSLNVQKEWCRKSQGGQSYVKEKDKEFYFK